MEPARRRIARAPVDWRTMEPCDLLLDHASQVVTLAGPAPRRRKDLDAPGVLENAAVAITKGRIVGVDSGDRLRERFVPERVLDTTGGCIVPGFVDAHTHPVFAATREREFDMRLRGATYQEITAQGGGIFSSVRSLRAMPDDSLEALTKSHFDRFLENGTTTIEAKSGYGLTREDELRSLEILRRAGEQHAVEVLATFLGAHQMPKEWQHDRDGYLRLLIEEVLPEVKRRGLARACDVFCDDGAYTVEESRRLLVAAKAQGFALRVHADELKRLGATELAVELGAESADHLCRVDEGAIAALAESSTCGVLLPGTVLSLGLKAIPPVRTMIDRGVAIAVATDFNPGTSYTSSMPFCIALACDVFRITVAEALAAATINAAWSLGISDRVGSIEVGKQADLVVLDRPSYLFLGYELGSQLVRTVVKNGRIVVEKAPVSQRVR